MISCYFGSPACKEVTSACTISFRNSERRVKVDALTRLSIVTSGVAGVSDSAEVMLGISAAERVIIVRS